MKAIIFFLTLVITIINIGCNDDSSGKGTHGLEKPEFFLDSMGTSGYASEDVPLEIVYIIDENSIKGDSPYTFIWDFGDGSELKESLELEQTHLYKKQGIYNAKVIMRDNDYISDEKTPDEFYVQELTIVAKTKVDLAIQIAQIDKILYDKNDTGEVSIKVANLGNEPSSETIKLKAFLSKDQQLDESDYELGEAEIGALAEAESIQKDIDFTISSDLTPGNYWVIVKVDYDNFYIESNEGNNTSVINSQIEILGATGRSPDLTFESVVLPEFFIVNDMFRIKANILNQGETASLPFSYKLILSKNDTLDTQNSEDNDDVILKYDYISDSIISGDTLSVNIDASISEEGEFYLFLVLDPTNDVQESDEDNNIVRSDKITVGQTLSGVDLVPFNMIVSPLVNIKKGKTLSISYSVRNRGNRPALKTNTRIFLSKDENLDENDFLLPFEGGDLGELDPIVGSLTIDKTHRVKVPDTDDFIEGDYFVLVDINYIKDGETTNPIEEVDYTNNLLSSRMITIEGSSGGCSKDIVVDNLEVLPNPAFEGSPFTLKFDILNAGNESLASFVTKIYIGDSGVDLDDDNFLKKNYNISRLSENSRLSKEIVLDIPSHINGDRYCVLVKADATNTIGECDEENNSINYCFDVTVRGNDNDILVSDVNLSANNIDLNEETKINVDFKVENLGTTNTATFYCNTYFSPDDDLSPDTDFISLEKYIVYNVEGGEALDVTDFEVTVPANMGNRIYNVYVKCDSTNIVPETDETNNISAYSELFEIKNSTSGCNADNYELNDNDSLASLIDLTDNISASICDQDIDWYHFSLEKSHKFRIDLEQGFSDKDIDLALYKVNDSNELIEVIVSDTTEVREKIEKNILADEDEGEYYLKVYPKNYDNMTKTDYTLQVSYDEVGGPGVDLSLKDVNTDTINNILTDVDFDLNFKVENLMSDSSGGFVVGIYLSLDSNISEDDTILSIISSDSLNLLENHEFQTTLRLTEELTSGLYNLIIQVDPYGLISETNRDNNTYVKELMVNYETSCELDQLEPNSWEPFLGKVVSNGNYSNLKLCSEDKDVYLIYLKKNSVFSANVYFSDDDGDIDIKLYKPDDIDSYSGVASSTSMDDDEAITYTAEETGFYIFKIYKFASGEVAQTYSMNLSGIVDGYNFINNKLEVLSTNLATDENIFFKYKINSASTKDLVTAMNYKIYLSADPILDESIDTIIYDEIIEHLNLGESIEKRIKVRLPSGLNTGNYYFISKVDSEDVISELNENDNLKIKPATIIGECQEDRFESNNSMAEADRNDSILSVGSYDNLTICPTDRDYYKIYLTSGLDLFINMYFIDPIGDLDLVLYDPEGNLISDSSSETNDEHIHLNVVDSGWYFIRVDGVEYDTNAYDLEILTPNCDEVECNNGICDFTESGQTICACDIGYTGEYCDTCDDGYHDNNGSCIIDEVCGADSCIEPFKNSCAISSGVVVCFCNSGYDDDDGICLINCDSDANSEANDTNDACVCKTGYHDALGVCTINEECVVDSCTEPNQTVCNVVSGIVECSCDTGYHTDPEDTTKCIIDEECVVDSCTESNKSVCNVVDGIAVCSCDDGYTGDSCDSCDTGYHTDPDDVTKCIIDEECVVDSCTESNKSVCNVVDGVAVCSCDDGYTGDSCDSCNTGYHTDPDDATKCIAD